MKALLTLLLNNGFIRKFSILIGLIAISSLIWVAGPKFGLTSVELRLTLIAIIILLPLLFYLYCWLRDKKRGNALEKDLQTASSDNAYIGTLRTKMQEAIAALKASQLGIGYRGNTALYALPWYLIIGPSAAGKTTLLRNSGLNFPLASQADIHVTGFGGTRNCDWWFSDEAVILDTAGRYTTETNDKEEWLAFLKILAKHRKKLPINGVVIAISLADLLTGDITAINNHANIIRDRVEELTHELGYLLPVNVILTKCDLLKGFSEFFQQFSATECEQVWGLSLTDVVSPKASLKEKVKQRLAAIEKKFGLLHAKLTQLRMQKLTLEQTADVKTALYDFPEQFRQATNKLQQFFNNLLHDNPYQNELNLAGIFFTSGCQEGLSIERNLARNHNDFLSGENIPKGNLSFFIKRLLKEVIFENRFAARLNRRQQLIRSWVKTGVISVAISVIMLAIIFWATAYTINANLLDNGVDSVAELKTAFTSPDATKQDVLTAQLNIYNAYLKFSQYSDIIPFYKRLGLYQGNQEMPYLSATLMASLQNTMLKSLSTAMTERLQYYVKQWPHFSASMQAQNYNDYYQTLRDYLLLGLQANQDVTLDAQYLSKVWALQLAGRNPSTPINNTAPDVNTQQLAKLTLFYLQNPETGIQADDLRTGWLPDSNLVAFARQQLYRPVASDMVYAKMTAQLQAELPELTITQLINADGSDMFNNPNTIPGMYTADAWISTVYNVIQTTAIEASRGDWVLTAPLHFSTVTTTKPTIPEGPINTAMEKQLIQALRKDYFRDYINTWNQWLSEIQLNNFLSLDDASRGLQTLSLSNGPLANLFQNIADNLSVENTPDDSSIAPEMAQAFNPVIKFLGDGSTLGLNSNMKAYFANLSKIQNKLHSMAISGDTANEAHQYASDILQANSSDNQLYQARSKITDMVNNISDQTARTSIDNLLISPLSASWKVILTEAAQGVQTQWESQVLPTYQGAIATRFPFNPGSGQDVDINSVKQFLELNTGSFWQFVNTSLKPFVQLQGTEWRTATWLGIGMNFNSNLISQLNQAQQISLLLFSNDTPQFAYSIYPIPESNITELQFTANGKVYRYQNGPQEWQSMQWSSSDSQQGAQILVQKGAGIAQAQLDAQGLWSLFHLLDKASRVKQGNQYIFTWQLSGNDGQAITAKLKFRTDSAADAVQAFVAKPFTLPNSIIQNAG